MLWKKTDNLALDVQTLDAAIHYPLSIYLLFKMNTILFALLRKKYQFKALTQLIFSSSISISSYTE